jgi:hypothetical protein
MASMHTVFEYRYRDAGNFKACGEIALRGALTPEEIATVRARFPGDGFFIAEQLDVPPLYESLYQWSHGPTADDHCWHEFVAIYLVNARPADMPIWGKAKDFVERLVAIDTWNEVLSPHFDIAGRLSGSVSRKGVQRSASR